MRLRRLDLTRYGKFTDVSLDFGAAQPGKPDLHIVYGLNEAGKSTAFSAYLDLLFGIPGQSGYGFLHPYSTMQIGGMIEDEGRGIDLVRVKRNANSLLDSSGQPVNEAVIGAALGGMSRKAYATMFSLDDTSLKEGGMAILESRGDLGELLFSASAGLADVSRTLGVIEKEAEEIYRRRAKSTLLAGLKQTLAGLKEKRAEIDTQASAYGQLVQAEAAAAKAYAEAEAELSANRGRQAEIARLLQALPAARELERIAADLAALGPLPRPARGIAAELPQILRDATRLQTRALALAERLERLEKMLEATASDTAVLALTERFEALEASRARYRTAELDLPRKSQELADIEASLRLALADLGRPDEREPAALLLPAPVSGTLRDLIERKSGIDARLAASEREMQRLLALRAELERETSGPTPPSPAVEARVLANLSAAMDQLRRSGLDASLEVARRDLAQQRQRQQRQLAEIELWTGTPAELAALQMPDWRQIDGWRQEAGALQKRITAHAEKIRSLRSAEREARLKLEMLTEGGAVPDDETARAARRTRDALWQAHRSEASAKTAEAFEAAMRRDDSIGEARLSRASDLAELRQRQQALRLDAAALSEQEELRQQAETEFAALGERVAARLPRALPQPDEPLEDRLYRLERFAGQRLDCLALGAAVEEAEARVGEIRHRIETAVAHLGGLLAQAGAAARPGDEAASLLAQADDLIARAQEAESARLSRTEREQALKRDEATRRRDLDDAREASSRWDNEWNAALAETWFAGDGNPVRVRARLDGLAQLGSLIRERVSLVGRIEAMERDRQQFGEALAGLYRLLDDMEQPDELDLADRALSARLAQARRTEDQRDSRQQEIATVEAEQAALAAEQTVHDSQRQRLLAAFGLTTLDDEAGLLIERIGERDRLEDRRRELEAAIPRDLRLANLDEALRALSTIDNNTTEQEHAALADRIALLETRVRELFGTLTLARDRLEAVGGDGAVAALEAERTTVLLEMEEHALRYLRLKTGMLAASGALELYREKHRSTMMRRASEAFRQITRGDYSGLAARIEKDREILIGQTREGGSRLADEMSTGTRTQLYLALRLAGYEEFAKVRPPVPFIADDIMETFDEPRSEQVFRLFADMAGIGQVIYLTHHRHLCDIARSVVPEVTIHAL